MLLQEYVADLLAPRIPDGWEEDMLRREEEGIDEEVAIPFLATSGNDNCGSGNETEDSSRDTDDSGVGSHSSD